MTITTPLNFEATTDLLQRMHAYGAPVQRERVGAMEVVSGLISAVETVSLVIDGATGESVQVH